MKRLGLDIGSTTVKCVVLDADGQMLYCAYKRHCSQIQAVCCEMLQEVAAAFPDEEMSVAISGSAGMGLAEQLNLPFVQEVYATRIAVEHALPETDVVVELGGEDAKIIFLTDGFEMRMNGTCAGGTGAFIDQMASLMDVTPEELDALAANHKKVYTIASRCGVFAKSDVQPLLNQGACKEDVAAGILYAVVNQTVAGLAQGREMKGRVVYLGGPLTFLPELRRSFDDVLQVKGTCPEHSLYYVALGAAMSKVTAACSLDQLVQRIASDTARKNYEKCAPLFASPQEYEAFCTRHRSASNLLELRTEPADEMFLGIDAGSTTVKAVLCDSEGNLFRPMYEMNHGNPVPIIRNYLSDLYRDYPHLRIRAAAVTGYGEELVKNAFHVDFGVVETVAHYAAARRFCPDVDFILDIGGQDIKCFRIRNGAIDSIFLNEACSSGCGSFLQTFAAALGYSAEDFFREGLFAEAPVDLGSRCTVFMNSAVKQAQREGASIPDISAGLSISVVKNALYKVIRCGSTEELGNNIVVQGGTFLNDGVLRAFEQELGREVLRPQTAAIMGAYGAALYAMQNSSGLESSALLTEKQLRQFRHQTSTVICEGCGNHCHLTVNLFNNHDRYIAGNRCTRFYGSGQNHQLNLCDFKRKQLKRYRDNRIEEGKPTIGIPMGLNFYELLPFWYTFWKTLGFNVLVSPESSRALYRSGQYSIPSDTVCYPAKLMHGHIEWLLERAPDAIFYPDMTYNVDEHLGGNHYNCPVVAYYPQVLKNNVEALRACTFIDDFISLHNRKGFFFHIRKILDRYFPGIPRAIVRKATDAAYQEYESYLARIRKEGTEILEAAQREKRPIIMLCGRPYHIDPEINHGVDHQICALGAAVLTEDSVSHLVKPFDVAVMNQWTYHSRLYAAAKFVAVRGQPGIQLVQLVSFGCGVDAVTSDEVRSIVERCGKYYTQLKIDEISNMGAVRIRLRSLLAAISEKEASEVKA